MIGQQTTIARSVAFDGQGLHTGNRVRMTLSPAPADHGIVFRRVDREPPLDIPARVDQPVPEEYSEKQLVLHVGADGSVALIVALAMGV